MRPDSDRFHKMREERGMKPTRGLASRLMSPDSGGMISMLLGSGEREPGTMSPHLQSRTLGETMGASPSGAHDLPIEEMRATLIQMIMEMGMQGGMAEPMMQSLLEEIQQMDDQEIRSFYRNFMDGFEGKGTSPLDTLEQYKASPDERSEEWKEPGFIGRLMGK